MQLRSPLSQSLVTFGRAFPRIDKSPRSYEPSSSPVSAGNQRADSRLTRIDHPEPAGAGRAVLTPPFRLDGARTPPGSAGDFARADGRVRETRDMEITIETPSHPFMNHGQRHSHLLTGLGNGYD